MSEQYDPFSFQQLPTAEDHVNDAFAKLNLREPEAPAFHHFLTLALKPIHPVTHETAESFNVETSNRLVSVINTISLARSRCAPHFEFSKDLTETFMIVASMPSLFGNGYTHMSDMLCNPFHANTMVAAHQSLMALRRVNKHLAKTGLERRTIPHNMYDMLTREEKLLVELRSVQLAREAVSAIHNDTPAKVLADMFEKVTRMRPMMTNDNSLMVKYFRSIHQAIDEYISTHGAPTGESKLGDRLRQYVANPGLPDPETVKNASEPPVSGASNVVRVPFGRPRSKPL